MELRGFTYRKASYRLGAACYDRASQALRDLRIQLETYIISHPAFLTSLTPVPVTAWAPEIALRMHKASELTGLGPMAGVAGTMAQMACEACREAGLTDDIIVENGGDIYMALPDGITVGLYAGESLFKGKLALRVKKEQMPLAVCSSSGRMGHSLSLGDCDLATVTSKDAALADSAATLAGNLVKSEKDLEPAVNRILAIPGILGVFLVKNDKIGLGGELPELVSLDAPDITGKVTRDLSESSSFPGV